MTLNPTLPGATRPADLNTPDVPTWAVVSEAFQKSLTREAIAVLFDRTCAEGALQTLCLAQAPDAPHEIAFILIAPEGLTEGQWATLIQEADFRWCEMDEARELGDLSAYSPQECEAFEQNVDGMACYMAAQQGWDVRPVSTFAWCRKVLPL